MLQLIHTCSISRNVSLGTNGRTQLQSVGTGVACLAIPMSAKTALQNGFDISRAYFFYFSLLTTLKVGDKLTYAGDTYVVSAIQVYNMPLVGHQEVMAAQEVS